MIALDTNLPVYAHRRDSEWHGRARQCIGELAAGSARWALPWPCLHEFLAVVTHPRIYRPPTTLELAVDQVRAWLESPSVVVLSEEARHFETLVLVLERRRVVGPRVHDAHVAALCLDHGVSELWSADRDFSRFGDLKVRNPL